ncbi:VOC family protein [Parvularcula marina]|uniref:VOC family protein n=1 Tax=Parvularcula marina TaxID=2292771 RepID=A0A371RLF0_9PROT|nr:VOC family protein [Parvularcula marina]RFB06196.1 VOC family protein [Parvularcula marina]
MEFSSKLRTCLWVKDQAKELAEFYTSLLPDSKIDAVYDGMPGIVEFTLSGAPFMVMNMNDGRFPASAATSISVLTEDQEETDRLWSTLIADGGEESMCGWLKDRYGFSWQIVPKALPRLLHAGDAAQAQRVGGALMAMKKIDIAGLEAAATG